MSGEFGSDDRGYIHTQIDQHAEDCLRRDTELTKLWGELFKAMSPMTHIMCWYEAADSAYHSYVQVCIKELPELQKRLNNIKEFIKPFEDVANNAVREYAEKKHDFEGGPR